MADVDILSLEEQGILVWIAEAEIGVAEPLPVSIADLSSERLNTTIDRLVRDGFLSREFPWLDHDHSRQYGLSVALTGRGAQVVVELWLRRLRTPPKTLLSA